VYSKILKLRFPATEVQKPVVCNLARELRSDVQHPQCRHPSPQRGFHGAGNFRQQKKLQRGRQYLKRQGVDVQNASREIKRNENKCTHCGSCTAVCPTGALSVKRPEMAVEFDQQKCSVCELCVTACPPRAMEVRPTNQLFFE
jgi:ferredoxin